MGGRVATVVVVVVTKVVHRAGAPMQVQRRTLGVQRRTLAMGAVDWAAGGAVVVHEVQGRAGTGEGGGGGRREAGADVAAQVQLGQVVGGVRRRALAARRCAAQVRRRGKLRPAGGGDDAGADAARGAAARPLRTALWLPLDGRAVVLLAGAAAAAAVAGGAGARLVVHVGAAHYDIVDDVGALQLLGRHARSLHQRLGQRRVRARQRRGEVVLQLRRRRGRAAAAAGGIAGAAAAVARVIDDDGLGLGGIFVAQRAELFMRLVRLVHQRVGVVEGRRLQHPLQHRHVVDGLATGAVAVLMIVSGALIGVMVVRRVLRVERATANLLVVVGVVIVLVFVFEGGTWTGADRGGRAVGLLLDFLGARLDARVARRVQLAEGRRAAGLVTDERRLQLLLRLLLVVVVVVVRLQLQMRIDVRVQRGRALVVAGHGADRVVAVAHRADAGRQRGRQQRRVRRLVADRGRRRVLVEGGHLAGASALRARDGAHRALHLLHGAALRRRAPRRRADRALGVALVDGPTAVLVVARLLLVLHGRRAGAVPQVVLLLQLLLLLRHLEGEQFFRVQRVQRAQVRYLLDQLRAQVRLVRVVLRQHRLQQRFQFVVHLVDEVDIAQARSICIARNRKRGTSLISGRRNSTTYSLRYLMLGRATSSRYPSDSQMPLPAFFFFFSTIFILITAFERRIRSIENSHGENEVIRDTSGW